MIARILGCLLTIATMTGAGAQERVSVGTVRSIDNGALLLAAAQAREKRNFEGNEIVASPAAYVRASRSTTASPNSAKSRHAQRGNPLKSRLASLTEA
jgi:predicted amidohydrolase